MCTALLVPFTTLCATFLAVIAVFFATCLAVRAGPACTLPAQTANARMTENNAFIVPKVSRRTRQMRLSRPASRRPLCAHQATRELRGYRRRNPKRSATVRILIEDCAESFLVVAQTPSVFFREVSDFGLTRYPVRWPHARQVRFVDTAMFRFL